MGIWLKHNTVFQQRTASRPKHNPNFLDDHDYIQEWQSMQQTNVSYYGQAYLHQVSDFYSYNRSSSGPTPIYLEKDGSCFNGKTIRDIYNEAVASSNNGRNTREIQAV